MRVLHLISGLMLGGGQKVASDLCEGLRECGPVDTELGLLGCRFDELRCKASFVIPYDGKYGSVPSVWRTAMRLREVLRERSYDVVHSHGWDADVIARWAMGNSATPQVIHLHVSPSWIHSTSFKHAVRRRWTRHVFGASQVRIIAVAQAVKDYWAQVFVETEPAIKVIHNGADTNRFHPAPREAERRGPIVFGAAGRLALGKGFEDLLEAMAIVAARSPEPVRLDIAGEGRLREYLESRVAALGLKEHVRFAGFISDMAGFCRSVDVFVLPSHAPAERAAGATPRSSSDPKSSPGGEGLPLVVLEAMASGVPVVATDVGGTSEVLRDGREGRIVEPGSTQALAQAMMETLSSDQGRATMGANARWRICREFSTAIQCSRVLDLYHSAVPATAEACVV